MAGTILCLVAVVGAAITWFYHIEQVHQADELATLRQIPTVQDYSNATLYRAQKNGIQSAIIESISSQSGHRGMPESIGSWVLTYRGPHPPGIMSVELDSHARGTGIIILGQGWGGKPLYPSKIGPNRYYYWSTQWNTPSPFTARATRKEYQASTISIHLSSGRVIHLRQRLAARSRP